MTSKKELKRQLSDLQFIHDLQVDQITALSSKVIALDNRVSDKDETIRRLSAKLNDTIRLLERAHNSVVSANAILMNRDAELEMQKRYSRFMEAKLEPYLAADYKKDEEPEEGVVLHDTLADLD